MIRKHWKKLLVLLVIIFLVIQVIGSFFFYELAIKRGPKDFLQNNADLEVSDQTMELFLNGDWIDWVNVQQFEQLTLTSRDGLQLSGYYLPASKPTDKVVVLTHGYLGHAKQMGLFGQYYHNNLGYNIFMPDARGHGKSEGNYYGFGWPDRIDLIDWTQALVKKLGPDSKVVYHGLSMGAATVLMASGEDEFPHQVKAIIADSPYMSVYQLFAYQMNRMFYLPAFPLLDSTSLLTKIRAGYSFREASALKAVEKADVPILYIHGESDTFVPTKLTKELYQQTSSDAELFLVPGANHGESFALAQDEYKVKIDHFLSRNNN
ncbi:alpha/beta hydrolase [Sporosarcina sp. FSL K6-2383]|uniref:alpha/beta hydrolase n=1 Tax=Sporosarcina sp. FSL K6-2383 TaxID=2921556 RepID=UPI00315A4F36